MFVLLFILASHRHAPYKKFYQNVSVAGGYIDEKVSVLRYNDINLTALLGRNYSNNVAKLQFHCIYVHKIEIKEFIWCRGCHFGCYLVGVLKA